MELFNPVNLTKFHSEFPKMTAATPEVGASQSTGAYLEYRCPNTTVTTVQDDSSPDAFVYIVVVLSFYALAMTILMVKYIRRENQEAQLSYYFHEFINREKFHTPRYQNRQGVNAIKRTLNKFYQSVGLVEPDKHTPLHEVSVSHDLAPYKPEAQRLELLDACSYSDSGVGSEASSHHGNHHGSSSIMLEADGEDVDDGKSDDELLLVEGSTKLSHPGHRDEILPQLNLLESAV